MRHYTMTMPVAKGTGDYGTDNKCIFDGLSSDSRAKAKAQDLANEFNRQVDLFMGKRIGRLVAQFNPQS